MIKIHTITVRYLPTAMFLGMYFMTAVLGNLIYASPWGEVFLESIGYPTTALHFESAFTPLFFVLLLLPFFITPLVVYATVKLSSRLVPTLARIPEIGKPEFALAALFFALFLGDIFWRGDVLSLFTQGNDMASSVEFRFKILARIGTVGLISLHSVLWFLSIYAWIRVIRSHELFWIISFILTFLAVTLMLTMLNMKWPVLVYLGALLIAAFIYSSRPYIVLMVGPFLILGAYFAISSFVYRTSAILDFETAISQEDSQDVSLDSQDVALKETIRVSTLKYHSSPFFLMLSPLNRMALAVPYYYEVFSKEGPLCGDIFWWRHPPCVPSYLIYTRIYPTDKKFAGRGTSPAAVHISGYAKGGFSVAVATLIVASIILGLYSVLPLAASSTLGALFVTGSVAGYHFSQLPIDGPIIYDHGVLYSTVVAVLLISVSIIRRKVTRWT